MPCNPEELAELARLLSDGKFGESFVRPAVEPLKKESGAVVEAKRKLGFFFPLRNQRGAFGDKMVANALNPLQRTIVGLENERIKAYDAAHEVFTTLSGKKLHNKLWGIGYEEDKRLASLLEHTNMQGDVIGVETTEAERKAVKMARGLYNKAFQSAVDEGVMDPDLYLNLYRPLIHKKPAGILRDLDSSPELMRIRERLSQKDIKFIHSYERTGNIIDPDETFTAGYRSYIDGLNRIKIARSIDKLEREFVNNHFDTKIITRGGRPVHLTPDPVAYSYWLDYKDSVLGGPAKGDMIITNMLQKLVEGTTRLVPGMETKTVDGSALYKISNIISSLFYSGTLGGPLGTRPASLVRHAFRLVPSFSDLGPKAFVEGFSKAVGAVTTNRQELERLAELGILSSPLESLEQRVGVARGVGRVVSKTSEAFLSLFRASDQLWRASTALGAESRFNYFLNLDQIERIGGTKPMVERLVSLVKQGKSNEAKLEYMFDKVANLEYIYGKANRPAVFRGAMGQMMGMLMSYPINTLELYRHWGARAIAGDPLPLLRQIAVAGASIWAGAEFLQVDMSNVFMHGAFPEIPPMLDYAQNTYRTGRMGLQAIVGNLTGVGEDNFHRRKRKEAQAQFAKGMQQFVPGGLFFFQNMPTVLDDGDVMKFLGFPPVAEIRDQEAKEKMRQRRSTPEYQEAREEERLRRAERGN